MVIGAAGVAGGLIGAILIVPILARTNFLNTKGLLGALWFAPEAVVTRVEEKTIIVPRQDFFKEAIAKTSPSVVGIQSFAGGRLVRSGSGIVLTQDGLVVTLASLVPPEANFIQAVVNGNVYPVPVVSRDYRTNLAIVSIPASGLPVVRLKTDLPSLGQHLAALGKVITFGKDNSLVAEPLVSFINDNNKTFSIAMGFSNQLYGSALLDGEGAVSGLVDFRSQKPVAVFSSQIQSVLDSYLNKPKRN